MLKRVVLPSLVTHSFLYHRLYQAEAVPQFSQPASGWEDDRSSIRE